MNKKTKKLLKENNRLDKQIKEENQEALTNIIVYLRGKQITEYNQEKIRFDITQMILDGQERGDTIEQIIGDDYKEFCDSVVCEVPQLTKKQKIYGRVSLLLSCVWIIMVITIIKQVLLNLAEKIDLLQFRLSNGDLLNFVLYVILANVVVELVCRNAFETPRIKNKVLRFLVTWLICCMILGSLFAIAYFMNTTIVKTTIIIPAILVIICYATEYVLKNSVDM
ncbi:hypothetical protein lbkm_2134 [Lachnospiraceae bacterium KM106-2]|nr:hypothetical protein lbkm_2134 [Lachnospiraceae bacterium KM106-2]